MDFSLAQTPGAGAIKKNERATAADARSGRRRVSKIASLMTFDLLR